MSQQRLLCVCVCSLIVLFALARSEAKPIAAGAPTRAESTTGLFLNKANETQSGTVIVDATGKIHVSYSAFGGDAQGKRPAYYATCASNCGSAASWSTATIGDGVSSTSVAYLGFDAAGHPRMIIKGFSPTYLHQWQYSECNANCTSSASWSVPILVKGKDSLADFENVQAAAFDPQGRPRIIYADSDTNNNNAFFGSYYAYCDSSCTDPVNWFETRIYANRLKLPALTFTASGQPRLLAGDWTSISTPIAALNYLLCDITCGDASNWSGTQLYEQGDYSYWSLRLDSQGRPRAAFYQDETSGGQVKQLYYVWCNTTCGDGVNWDGASVGLAQSDGQEPDLALDAQGRPRIAYDRGGGTGTGGGGLGYVTCDTACESASGVWQDQLFESNNTLDTDWPAAGSAAGFWYGGYRPSLALNAGGSPFIEHTGRHLCTACGPSGGSAENWRAARFVFGGGGVGGFKLFLPLIRR